MVLYGQDLYISWSRFNKIIVPENIQRWGSLNNIFRFEQNLHKYKAN
jgi:hypothetical protein